MLCISHLYDGTPIRLVPIDAINTFIMNNNTMVAPPFVYTCSQRKLPMNLFYHFATLCPSLLTAELKEVVNVG